MRVYGILIVLTCVLLLAAIKTGFFQSDNPTANVDAVADNPACCADDGESCCQEGEKCGQDGCCEGASCSADSTCASAAGQSGRFWWAAIRAFAPSQ